MAEGTQVAQMNEAIIDLRQTQDRHTRTLKALIQQVGQINEAMMSLVRGGTKIFVLGGGGVSYGTRQLIKTNPTCMHTIAHFIFVYILPLPQIFSHLFCC